MATQFYDPRSWYGGTWAPGQWAQTPVGFQGYLEDPSNWDAAYTRHLANLGIPDYNNRGRLAASLYPRYAQGYRAALATNPTLTFRDYLGQAPDPTGVIDAMTPAQRGESPGLFAGRARTISRGL